MASEEHTYYQEIRIEDVDQSLYDWFDLKVNSFVETPTRELKKVPVVYASGERWATARDERGIRDKNGLLILPIISVRRTSIDRSAKDRLALGIEQGRFQIARRIDPKTNTLQNALGSRLAASRKKNDKTIYEITTIPFPEQFVTNYEVIVKTQYITQMNEIIQKMFSMLDVQSSFVMPLNASNTDNSNTDGEYDNREPLKGYYFVGFVDTDLSDTGNFEEFTDTERIVQYSFNVLVPTYLMLDSEGNRPAVQTELTSYEFKFADEDVEFYDNEEDLDEFFAFKKPK